MTQEKIIEDLYKRGVVKDIIHNIAKFDEHQEDLKDLEQDIYIILMSKGDKIVEIYNETHLNYYIANIVYTQLRSTTSPYYLKYKRFRKITDNIDDTKL